jgi:hypothetical protein
MISCVLILPVLYREAGNALAIALGHDVPPGNTYSVSLSSDGGAPATHYGCHTWATAGFVDMIKAAANGAFPQIPGVSPEQIAGLMGALVYSTETEASPLEHFDSVIARHDLKTILAE